MLRSVKSLQGAAIRATDGELGHVEQFFFDDEQWVVRYMVVDTGDWLTGRKVLVSPMAIDGTDWEANTIRVNLTRDQVRASPDIDTQRPVSRQQEANYAGYYGWPLYWGGAGLWGGAMYPGLVVAPPLTTGSVDRAANATWEDENSDPHLRSTNEVTGYAIQAIDGDLGHLEDFIADDETWAIRYISIDTRNWWPGKKVLLAPEWIERVSWTESAVAVSVTREQIKSAPEWDASAPIDRAYEERLHRHYERTGYWEDPRLRRAA